MEVRNKMFYKLSSISYTFPYRTRHYIINQFNKNIPSEENMHLCGVLKPYIGKKLTESEADNLLAKIILMHPFMEGAMDIQIEISWFNNGMSGFYQVLNMHNSNDPKESKEYIPTPIQWR